MHTYKIKCYAPLFCLIKYLHQVGRRAWQTKQYIHVGTLQFFTKDSSIGCVSDRVGIPGCTQCTQLHSFDIKELSHKKNITINHWSNSRSDTAISILVYTWLIMKVLVVLGLLVVVAFAQEYDGYNNRGYRRGSYYGNHYYNRQGRRYGNNYNNNEYKRKYKM